MSPVSAKCATRISYFTNLTCLNLGCELILPDEYQRRRVDFESLTRLKNLKTLEIGQLILEDAEANMIGSMTHVDTLSLERASSPTIPAGRLQKKLIDNLPKFTTWLPTLTHLTCLKLKNWVKTRYELVNVTCLQTLTQLQKLTISKVPEYLAPTWSWVTALNRLQSLTIHPETRSWVGADIDLSCPMMGLTKLHAYNCVCIAV